VRQNVSLIFVASFSCSGFARLCIEIVLNIHCCIIIKTLSCCIGFPKLGFSGDICPKIIVFIFVFVLVFNQFPALFFFCNLFVKITVRII